MWFDTKHVVLTAGVGTGSAEVVAFDAALRAAKIADFNLIRVTSIIPPGIRVHRMREGVAPICGNGLMLPTVYCLATSPTSLQMMSAAVGVGAPVAADLAGVIFPNSGVDLEEARCLEQLASFIAEGMEALRRVDEYRFLAASASTVASGDGWAAALAALCFCDDQLWELFQDVCDPME